MYTHNIVVVFFSEPAAKSDQNGWKNSKSDRGLEPDKFTNYVSIKQRHLAPGTNYFFAIHFGNPLH
jgi:hypothetical protein